MDASALDIGGSRARIYEFQDSKVVHRAEIWLPERRPDEERGRWAVRRVEAIARLVADWNRPLRSQKLATACAGRKDSARESVVESTYASPLPDLVSTVKQHTGIDLGPLFDDDVAAGWGHLASADGGLSQDGPNTILLTAGTGLAECLWVDGVFLMKGTYPRLSELGLEDPLRAEAWRDKELPLEGLERLVAARGSLARFEKVVLSGRFAAPSLAPRWPAQLPSGMKLSVCHLEEAPALGAAVLQAQGE